MSSQCSLTGFSARCPEVLYFLLSLQDLLCCPGSLPHSSLILPVGTSSSWRILAQCFDTILAAGNQDLGGPCKPLFGALKQEPFIGLREWSQGWKMQIFLLGPIQKSFSFVHVLKEREVLLGFFFSLSPYSFQFPAVQAMIKRAIDKHIPQILVLFLHLSSLQYQELK